MKPDKQKKLQQLKDFLPTLEEKIIELEEFSDRLSSMVTAAKKPKKVDHKTIYNHVVKYKDTTALLGHIGMLKIALSDHRRKHGVKGSDDIQKSLLDYEKRTKETIERLKDTISELANQKMPTPLKDFSERFTHSLQAYVNIKKLKVRQQTFMDATENAWTFAHYLQYTGTAPLYNKAKFHPEKTCYIVMYQTYALNREAATSLKMAVVDGKFLHAPLRSGFFEVETSKEKLDKGLSKGMPFIEALSMVVQLMDYHGFGAWFHTEADFKKLKNMKFKNTYDNEQIDRLLKQPGILSIVPKKAGFGIIQVWVKLGKLNKFNPDTGELTDERSDKKVDNLLVEVVKCYGSKGRNIGVRVLNIEKTTKKTKQGKIACYKVTCKAYGKTIANYLKVMAQ